MRIAAVSAGVLALLTAAVLLTRFQAVSARPSTGVAVLPFKNLSSDPANRYFAEGLAEEISNELTRVPDLRVIDRSSVASAGQKTSE